jgi:hypothetical protein
MRTLSAAALVTALTLIAFGCERKSTYEGPTVDKFDGRLVANGQPVQFPAAEKVQLKLFHEKGQSFNIPINQDGTFNIGWMPVGKYTATLLREKPGVKGPPSQYGVKGGLTVDEGKTDYKIELGKEWKP